MDVTKPFEFIGFGAMNVTKLLMFVYDFVGGGHFSRGGVLHFTIVVNNVLNLCGFIEVRAK